jgi:putative transposase
MPRGARKKSSPGVYHLVARGIYEQRIFNDEEDHLDFIEKIRKYKR